MGTILKMAAIFKMAAVVYALIESSINNIKAVNTRSFKNLYS
jgi:hypothetical protein